MSARNRELLGLIPVALLVTAGFTAVFSAQGAKVDNLSLTYGLYFLAICFATHIVIRIRLPYADPYLFPLVALLAAIGLVMLYRIDESYASKQASLFVGGLVLFVLTIVFLKDYHVLERYRYIIAIVGIGLLYSARACSSTTPSSPTRARTSTRRSARSTSSPRSSASSRSSSSWPVTCARSARC